MIYNLKIPLTLFCLLSLFGHFTLNAKATGNAKYVNPFVGSADNGHTFPGATVPFGMIQVSPETGNMGWDYCSGYRYDDKKIGGFSQTHLNGTGIPDLGDILLQPFTGADIKENYHCAFSKETESAYPGYYTVKLSDFGVRVELTATQRTSFHQYSYDSSKGTPKLLIDLQSGLVSSPKQLNNHLLESEMEFIGNNKIEGHNRVSHWVDRDYYFAIEFNKPFTKKRLLPKVEGEKASRYVLHFDLKKGEKLQVKIGISTVNNQGAWVNMKSESPAWDFNKICNKALAEWNKYLSRVQLEGTDEQKSNFYTSMYHLLIQPNNIADVDGQYRGADNNIYKNASKTYYSTLSLWDTYRAAHPLYSILTPERVDGFINTMIEHFNCAGYLPVWTLWGKENNCMIGNHAVPVIVDAYIKGYKGFDAEKAFTAIKSSLTLNHVKSQWDIYTKYGYLPYDLVKEESVSRTLEHCYDDYAASQMAKAMGKNEDFEFFRKRSLYYKNLFDQKTKLMRGKDSSGNWRMPFNSLQLSHSGTSGGDYTEGNAWQYTWSVQHDIDGLSELMGGKKEFALKLDSLFNLESKNHGTGFVNDVTGLIGQYAHGNEPSHHVAYIYALLGKPEKTQKLVRDIITKFYLNKPDGLSGNDDCGQMSAWYIFTAMGFYPLNPVGGEYVLGAPQLNKIRLQLAENKTFTIEAKNLSLTNKFVQSIILNGKPYSEITINHQQIMSGGVLVFNMSSKPNNN